MTGACTGSVEESPEVGKGLELLYRTRRRWAVGEKDHKHGDFAEGQEKAHDDEHKHGDFAEGQEKAHEEHEGDFAEGQEKAHDEHEGDFAEGQEKAHDEQP